MVGVAKRLDSSKVLNLVDVAQAYDTLLLDQKFRNACEQSTALEDNVKTRRDLAIAAFANC